MDAKSVRPSGACVSCQSSWQAWERVNPSTSAPLAYELSRNTTAHLVNAITGREEFDSGKHLESVQKARTEARSRRETESTAQFEASVSVLGNAPQRSLRRAKEFSTGAWLSAMPSARNDTILSAEEFRDGLAMRYSKPLLRLPGTCDGCGKAFSLDHGLNCPNGGNVIRRHNEVRDVVGQLASTAYSYVISEPVVREHGVGGNGDGALFCDLGVRGVWNPQRDVLLDFKVVNTDAGSYIHRPVRSVLESAAAQKKAKHKQACVGAAGGLHAFHLLYRWRHPPRRPALSPATFGTAGVEMGDVLQSSYGLRQHATVVGNPACFSSLFTWGPEEVFLPLQRLRRSHRSTFLDCLLSVFIFF